MRSHRDSNSRKLWKLLPSRPCSHWATRLSYDYRTFEHLFNIFQNEHKFETYYNLRGRNGQRKIIIEIERFHGRLTPLIIWVCKMMSGPSKKLEMGHPKIRKNHNNLQNWLEIDLHVSYRAQNLHAEISATVLHGDWRVGGSFPGVPLSCWKLYIGGCSPPEVNFDHPCRRSEPYGGFVERGAALQMAS